LETLAQINQKMRNPMEKILKFVIKAVGSILSLLIKFILDVLGDVYGRFVKYFGLLLFAALVAYLGSPAP
jgi:hypothetical protein